MIQARLGVIHVNNSCLRKIGKKVKSSKEGNQEDLEKQITLQYSVMFHILWRQDHNLA